MPQRETYFRVTTTVQTAARASGVFGRGLLLTAAEDLPAGGDGRAPLITGNDALTALTADVETRKAAAVWFGQTQTPQGLYVTRWASSDVNTTLRGGAAPSAANAAPLNAANASFRYDGNDYTVDLSSASTAAAIATAIQTAIQGNLSGATFTFEDGRYLLTRPDAAPGDAFFGPHSAGTGTDVTEALGFAQSQSPRHLVGHAAESASDAVAEIQQLGNSEPKLVMRTADTADSAGTPAVVTDDDLRDYAQGENLLYLVRDTSTTRTIIEDAYDNQQFHTIAIATKAGEYPDVGAAARLSAVDYEGRLTQISLMAKALVNVSPTTITDSNYDDLIEHRGNIYTNVDGQPGFVEGFTSHDDYFADEAYGLIWLEERLAGAQWSAARQSRRLTRAGLLVALRSVFSQAVANGILQPGLTVRPETAADIRRTTGNTAFGSEGGGVLTRGFLVWVGNVVDRTAPWKAWTAASPAIHRSNGDLIFLNDLQEAAEAAAAAA